MGKKVLGRVPHDFIALGRDAAARESGGQAAAPRKSFHEGGPLGKQRMGPNGMQEAAAVGSRLAPVADQMGGGDLTYPRTGGVRHPRSRPLSTLLMFA